MRHLDHSLGRFVRRLVAASWFGPLLVAYALYLYVGTCGAGRSGFVFALKARHVSITAGWCSAASD
jgi:hypothetical protein